MDRTQPLIISIIIGIEGKKLLMHQRKTEPFYNTWGFPGGKVRLGETMQECAAREFFEETGLKGKIELKAINEIRTFDNGELKHHHLHFIFSCMETEGSLIDTKEGPNRWMDENEISKLEKVYPDVPLLIEIAKSSEFRLLECDRHQKDGEFESIEIIKDHRFKTSASLLSLQSLPLQ